MFRRLTALSLALGLAAPVAAADFDVSLTDDSVKGQFNTMPRQSEIQLGAGYTYHEGSRHILNLDLHAQGQTAIGNLPTTAGIGFRAIGWDDDPADGGAVGVGGFATVNVPNVPGLSVGGSLHYAPSILSFGDSDDMTSFDAQASYRLIRNAEIFGGYRYVNTDLDPRGDLTLDEGVMAGIRLFF
ncbi:hypothetical protein CF392_07665 [Tamilnaduibacter salinus]|uniref:YfaZ n=1 Tax=Tamilnaduibacter salinus TaxID=1484056 RepID=A0A2A2I307_9GAMM|nr:YfaZ family outer membrane protein [Tamilnaduibacter salinus]PAV26099.1 hypothetical protein CF392_07665 [Tamilnaduibacter salinus]